MIIQDLTQHIKNPIKGVFHIGAHHAQEKTWYNQNGINKVVWFEANPSYEGIIKQKVGTDLVIISAVGNYKGKVQFNIANNGQSSSILEFGTHKHHHPQVYYTNKIEVDINRISDLVIEHNINISDFNFINMDIQGYELEALKSFDNLLEGFDYVYTEVNTGNVYDGCATMNELDEYLSKFGFVRVVQDITPFEWGDALYVKNNP